MAKLTQLGLRNRTDVYITTDHGFSKRFHLGSSFLASVANTFIASSANDLQCYAKSNVVDIVPTILEKMGAPLPDPSPLPGRSLLAGPDDPPYCWPGTCNDGILAANEDCEPGQPIEATCQELGQIRGTLGCTSACEYDVSGCVGAHPEISLRISGTDSDTPRLSIRSRSRETGGITFQPAVTPFGFSIFAPDNSNWRCAVIPTQWAEWKRSPGKFRWSGTTISCGIRALSFNVNEDKPYKMKMKGYGAGGFPTINAGDQIRLNVEVGGQTYEASLLCEGAGNDSLNCTDPLLD